MALTDSSEMASPDQEPQNRPQHAMILVTRTRHKRATDFGNSHVLFPGYDAPHEKAGETRKNEVRAWAPRTHSFQKPLRNLP